MPGVVRVLIILVLVGAGFRLDDRWRWLLAAAVLAIALG